MRKITAYQRLKKNILRSQKVGCYMDWAAFHKEYAIDYRTIKPLEHALTVLRCAGKIQCESAYNRGGRKGRDVLQARTVYSYQTANREFAFQLVRYHRASGHHLKVIGDMGKWHMFFEANLRKLRLQIQGDQLVATFDKLVKV